MTCIGFAGCEAFDVVLYISRTLTKLKYRVLIIDLSGTGALTSAIKHGMQLDSSQEIINYRDINYTRKIPSDDELKVFSEGVIITVYGNHYINCSPLECMSMNVVVNRYPHMIAKINELMQDLSRHGNKFNLLVRDVLSVDDVDVVLNDITMAEKFDKVSHLYFDLGDYESAIQCQRKQVVRFAKISSTMEKYILNQIYEVFPTIKKSKIKKAISLAKKGV